MSPNNSFFENLTPIDGFSHTLNQSGCVAVPEGWFLFITDIKGSTNAIRSGKYRDVNRAGALCILAIVNSDYYHKIPFIFGGDGIMFLVPPSALALFSDLMCAVRDFTREVLKLDLRVGAVPVRSLYQAGKQLAVGKLKFGYGGCSAVFEGDGIDFAEILVKSQNSEHLLSATHISHTKVNFDGFFCPFADIPSLQGHVMALIIKPLKRNWHEVAEELFKYIGDENLHHPLDAKRLRVNNAAHNVNVNAAIISGKNKGLKYYWRRLALSTKFLLLKRPSEQEKITQAAYTQMIPASDYRKYDGHYKIVFRCDRKTINEVMGWLTKQEEQGNFLFGCHLTNRSIMTCLFNGKGDERELHLIDAADGGYALAATMLKQKLYP